MAKTLRALAAAAATLALTACAASNEVGLAVQIAHGLYCTAVTEPAKQALRQAVSGGQKIVACPEGTVAMTEAPPAAAAAQPSS